MPTSQNIHVPSYLKKGNRFFIEDSNEYMVIDEVLPHPYEEELLVMYFVPNRLKRQTVTRHASKRLFEPRYGHFVLVDWLDNPIKRG